MINGQVITRESLKALKQANDKVKAYECLIKNWVTYGKETKASIRQGYRNAVEEMETLGRFGYINIEVEEILKHV